MQKTAEKIVSVYKFDDVMIDMTDFRVHKRGTAQKITPKAFEVLIFLIENCGRVVEKQEIFTEVWRENYVTDNALTRVVREIRQVIGDEATAPRYIETVPKRGYRFIAEVETIQAANGKAFEQNEKVQSEIQSFEAAGSNEIEKPTIQPAEKSKTSRLLFILVPLGLLILISFLIWNFYPKQTATAPPEIARNVQITNWSSLDNYPAISPDGNSIAYSSDHNGSFEIFVKSLTPGAREIQVTNDNAQNFQPSWSPDGERIAFYSRKRGGIWIVPASGGAARQLTDFGSRPAWSPDGQNIAFQSAILTDLGSNSRSIPPSVLWLVKDSGGEPRPLTQTGNPTGGHGSPAWSPDGKKIAFNVEDVAAFGFWTIEIETGNLKQMVPFAFDPIFSPDGRSIFYSTLSGIWKTDISAATGEVLGEPAAIVNSGAMPVRHLSLSAGGKRLAYTMFRTQSSIAAVPLDVKTGKATQAEIPIVENTSSRNTFPAFSPNGQKIAFVTYIPGKFAALNLIDADGKNQTQTAFSALFPNWFPDNERIGSLSRPGEVLKFSSFNTANGKSTEILELDDAEYARLSPDGKEIAFNSKSGGTINVWLANLETGTLKQLTFDNELMGFPAWSPDGKILGLQVKRGDNTHIALLPREGGTPEQLTDERGQSWVYSFSPDGDKLAFAGERDFVWNVYWISRSTKEQKKLTGNTKLNSFYRFPAWSPRGDQIVFEYAETNGNIWMAELK